MFEIKTLCPISESLHLIFQSLQHLVTRLLDYTRKLLNWLGLIEPIIITTNSNNNNNIIYNNNKREIRDKTHTQKQTFDGNGSTVAPYSPYAALPEVEYGSGREGDFVVVLTPHLPHNMFFTVLPILDGFCYPAILLP